MHLIRSIGVLAAAVAAAAVVATLSAASAQTLASPTPAASVRATAKPSMSPQIQPPRPPATLAPAATRPALGPAVEITPADNGTTITVDLNQQITLRLGADLNWTVIYTPEGILKAVPGVNARTRDVQAILYAAAPGTVEIDAEGKPICNPGQPCPLIISLFKATVVVKGGATTQQQPGAPTGAGTTAQQPASGPAAPPAPATARAIQLPNTGGHAAGNGTALAAILVGAAVALAAGGALALRRAGR